MSNSRAPVAIAKADPRAAVHCFEMNQMDDCKDIIRKTAGRIREVHRQGGRGFIPQYSALVDQLFPGGYDCGLRNIRQGDAKAIDSALAFLEVRPYFFRSQYIRTRLMRLLKHTTLDPTQAERFSRIIQIEHAIGMARKKNG